MKVYSKVRRWLTRFFRWHFRIVDCPALLFTIASSTRHQVIVTQSASPVVEGLLQALALKAGYAGTVRLTSDLSLHSSSEVCPDRLRWLPLHDTQALGKLLSEHESFECRTFNVFQRRGPVRNPPEHRLSFASLIGLVVSRRILHVVFGESLKIDRATVARVQRKLKVDFYRNLKLVRGTPLQPIATQARNVLAGQEFERELRILAERANIPVEMMRENAERVFFELAANPRRWMYSVLAFVSRLLLKKLFTEVKTRGLEEISAAIKDHPVVLVPMHRSHLDYIVLQSKLYDSNVAPPLVAAGINLSFWPVGFLTRSVGAFFVKRNARDRLHAMVLRRYVTYLVKRGHLQEFFIEGGRSRSGKMLYPKVGLLGILFDAYRQGLRKDILFVPVSISYEHVVEDSEFGEENAGGSKKKENLVSLLRAIDIFKRKYGGVTVRFGAPQSLSQFLAARRTQSGTGRTEEKIYLQEFGVQLVRSIRKHISPSLTSLAYTALMMAPRYGLTTEELSRAVHNLARVLSAVAKAEGADSNFTPLLERFLDGRDVLLFDLTRGGNVMARHMAGTTVFFIPGKRRFTADFYKNTSLHALFPPAFLALKELLSIRADSPEAALLYRWFAHDLILPPPDEYAAEERNLVETLRHEGLLAIGPHGERFTSHELGLFNPSLLLANIQSLLWVYYSLREGTAHRLDEAADSARGIQKAFAYAKFLAGLQSEFGVARYRASFTQTEAASRSSLVSTLETLGEREVIAFEERAGTRQRILVKSLDAAEIQLLASANHAILTWQLGLASRFPSAVDGCAQDGCAQDGSARG